LLYSKTIRPLIAAILLLVLLWGNIPRQFLHALLPQHAHATKSESERESVQSSDLLCFSNNTIAGSMFVQVEPAPIIVDSFYAVWLPQPYLSPLLSTVLQKTDLRGPPTIA
jgi:hypothetical protein